MTKPMTTINIIFSTISLGLMMNRRKN